MSLRFSPLPVLAALATLAAVAPASASLVTNPTFTYTHGSGSLDGWTLHGVEGESLRVVYSEATLNDYAAIRSGSAISQRVGRGYRLVAGDRITVHFRQGNEWNGRAIRVSLHLPDEPSSPLAEKIVPVTPDLAPATFEYTVPPGVPGLGGSLVLRFFAEGEATDNLWVQLDDVEVEIVSPR
jgi:hypothetical protein